MVNCKTDSTKTIICHQYVLLEQPILGTFCTMHIINTCTTLGTADKTFFSLSLPD